MHRAAIKGALHLYDELARSLLGKFSRMADGYRLWIAKRGNKDRTAALRTALEHAEADFTQSFGFSRGGADAWHTVVTSPRETLCLQAADYFLWALQRFYEPRVHPETGEVTHEACGTSFPPWRVHKACPEGGSLKR